MQLKKNLPGRVAPRTGQMKKVTALKVARKRGFFKSAIAVHKQDDGDANETLRPRNC